MEGQNGAEGLEEKAVIDLTGKEEEDESEDDEYEQRELDQEMVSIHNNYVKHVSIAIY